MKDFLVDENGDLVISKGDLSFVKDTELTAQKVRLILSTEKGEWFLNEDEGIYFSAILTKNPNEDEALDAILEGLRQIDETFQITSHTFKAAKRNLKIAFTAENNSGVKVDFAVSESRNAGNSILIVSSTNAEKILSSGDAAAVISTCRDDEKIYTCKT